MSAGEYVFGQIWNSTSAGYASASSLYRMSIFQNTVATAINVQAAPFGGTQQTIGQIPMFGVYTANTTAFPNSFASNHISVTQFRNRFFLTA